MASFFLSRWLDRLKASAREEIQETARSALLYVIAVIASLMALVFLTVAAFWWLAAEFDTIVAALIVAAGYAAVAVIMLIWASWHGSASANGRSSPVPADTERRAENPAAVSEASSFADLPGKMGVDLDSVAGTLSDAGYRTEALIVTASKELLKQLSPLQFVSLVFVASFLFGRRLRRS